MNLEVVLTVLLLGIAGLLIVLLHKVRAVHLATYRLLDDAQAGLQVVGELVHSFPPSAHGPGGVTTTLLLAESHLCVHTWPEQRAVTLDVYVCNFGGDHSAKAQALMGTLLALFLPQRTERHQLQRGTIATTFTPTP